MFDHRLATAGLKPNKDSNGREYGIYSISWFENREDIYLIFEREREEGHPTEDQIYAFIKFHENSKDILKSFQKIFSSIIRSYRPRRTQILRYSHQLIIYQS